MPTTGQYADWARRIGQLKEEVELATGENQRGCYPDRLSMLLHLACCEAYEQFDLAGRAAI